MTDGIGSSTSIWWRYSWRHLWQHKLRTSLTLVGIALGVAIVLAIQLANHTSLEKFKQSVALVSGQTDLIVQPTTSETLDEGLLSQLSWVWAEGFGQFTPVIDALGVYLPPNESITNSDDALTPPGQRALMGVSIPILGVDMAVDSQFRPFVWHAEPTDNLGLFRPNQIVITQQLAEDFSLSIGDAFPLLLNDEAHSLTIAGVMAENGLGKAYNGHLILMDIANAQSLLRLPGKIHRIELTFPKQLPPSVQSTFTSRQAFINAQKERLATTLPRYVSVVSPQLKGQQTEGLVKAFQLNLTALSIIALLVAMFLIYNTMSMAMLRRRGDIGTLRTLGLSRVGVFRLYLTEVFLLGVLGSLIGLGLGLLLATVTVKGVGATVEVLYTGLPTVGLTINYWTMAQAFGLGLIITLLAGTIPVWSATNTPPASATRLGAGERQMSQWLQHYPWVLPVISGTAFMGAYWASQQPPVDGFPLFGHACSFLIVLGSAFLMPVVLPPILMAIRVLLTPVLGWWADIALRQLSATLGRTSVAIASLMVAVAMAVSLSVMIHSFRVTVHDWVATSITSDIWIEADGRNVSTKRRINPDVLATISQVAGVEAIDPFLEMPLMVDGKKAKLAVGDFTIFRDYGNLTFLSGQSTRQVMAKALTNDGVLITEPFAHRHHLTAGQILRLPTPTGLANFPIAGVYKDFASEHGYITMGRQTFAKFWPDDGNALTGIAIYVDDHVDAGEVRLAIQQALPLSTRLNVMTRQHLRDEIFRIFDNTFSITYALHAIALTVAVLGIINTLVALILESRREFAILNYLGAGGSQCRQMVRLQGVLLGWLGAVFGVAVGCGLSLYLVNVINVQSFGWTIDMHWPWWLLAETTALMLVTSWVVGWFPARMVTRVINPSALRAE